MLRDFGRKKCLPSLYCTYIKDVDSSHGLKAATEFEVLLFPNKALTKRHCLRLIHAVTCPLFRQLFARAFTSASDLHGHR